MNEFGAAPVFECSDGVLHISSSLVKMRICFSPKPHAEKKDHRGRLKEYWPEFRLIAPKDKQPLASSDESLKSKMEAFEAFRHTIPQALCRIVEPFISHQWMLLLLIERSAYGRELAEANPVLAWLLANSYELRGTEPEASALQAASHSRTKQRNICSWLGFPGTQAMVRLIGKIPPECVSIFLLRRLLNAVKQDPQVMSLLSQRRRINAGVIDFIVSEHLRELATPRLFDEMERLDDEMVFATTADRLRDALHILKQINARRRVTPFQTLRQIENFAESADAEYFEYDGRRMRLGVESMKSDPLAYKWPPPPFPGTNEIVPVTSYNMLCEESEAQHNCASSYWKNIIDRTVYIYRLLQPVRATFSLASLSEGSWSLSQIKGPRNRKVSAKTRQVVENWLYGHSLSASHG